MVVYNAADRGPGGGFPYSSAALANATLTFDANGQPTGPASLTVPVPGGASLDLDISDMSQVAGDYAVELLNANGSAPSRVQSIEIASDGTLYEVYENGSRFAAYVIPLANVNSPDRLTPKAGNVYLPSSQLGRSADRNSRVRRARQRRVGRARKLDRGSCDRARRHDRGAAQLHGEFAGVPDGF